MQTLFTRRANQTRNRILLTITLAVCSVALASSPKNDATVKSVAIAKKNYPEGVYTRARKAPSAASFQ